MNQVNWNGSAAWSMTGSSTLSLFDFGGTQAKLESLGTGGVDINAPIVFAANNASPPNPFGEINAVNSDLVFSGSTLTVNGSSCNGIKLWGGGRTVTFNNTVSASGKWFGFTTTGGARATIGGSVTSGDWYVMNNGTLNLAAGGSLTTTALRLGGDFGNTGNQNQTLSGTFNLTGTSGGQTFSSTINSVSGNTSGALVINSLNSSGVNTLSGGIFLDSGLRITNAAGGTLSLSGTTDVKAQQIIFGPAGTITVAALTSSLGAGGTLLLNGPGTLNLTNTGATYTGTTSSTLNAAGTQITGGGTLGIVGDTSLGVAPAGSYNNLQFLGAGTLRAGANNITTASTRSILVTNGASATFDTGTNTLTVNGVINGAGTMTKTGNGTLVLNANNTYTGTTTVSQGTLNVAGSTASGSAVTVSSGATISGTGLVGGTLAINSGATLAPGNGGIGVLTNSGAPTLAGTTLMELNRAASPNADKFVRSGGSLTYGGALNVTNVGAAAQNGDTFTLFNATSYSGAFAALTLPPGGTTHWLTNNLGVNGSITFSNQNPVAQAITLGVARGESISYSVIGVGKHSATDVDGDALTVSAVGTATSGTAGFSASNVTYTASGNLGTNTFNYIVSDGVGGFGTNVVTVVVAAPEGFNRLSPPSPIANGTVVLNYLGLPGTNYALDWATNLTPPINWIALQTNTATTNGALTFTNTSTEPVNFFRTRYVP
jgi:autotransporter-associated beta strand protein